MEQGRRAARLRKDQTFTTETRRRGENEAMLHSLHCAKAQPSYVPVEEAGLLVTVSASRDLKNRAASMLAVA